jgi:hypothetical protein
MLFNQQSNLIVMKKLSFLLIALFITGSTFASIKPGKPATSKSAKVSINRKKAKKPVQLYWYQVNSNIPSGSVTNADCTFINYGTSASSGSCTGATDYYCIIGLSAGQVNTSNHQISGSQLPTTSSRRGINN